MIWSTSAITCHICHRRLSFHNFLQTSEDTKRLFTFDQQAFYKSAERTRGSASGFCFHRLGDCGRLLSHRLLYEPRQGVEPLGGLDPVGIGKEPYRLLPATSSKVPSSHARKGQCAWVPLHPWLQCHGRQIFFHSTISDGVEQVRGPTAGP